MGGWLDGWMDGWKEWVDGHGVLIVVDGMEEGEQRANRTTSTFASSDFLLVLVKKKSVLF